MQTDAELSEALAARTLALCRIPSVIQQEEALADHVEVWARGHFPADEIYRLNHTLVLGRIHDERRPTVALFGHLDTVPPHPGDPQPHRAGEYVFGLGSSDMKGGLALMMQLAESLDRDACPFNLLYCLYEREEGPYLENGLGPLFEAKPELSGISFAICLEPSDNVIQVGCCGALHAQLTFEGRSAHSARPWQGENAVHKAGPLLSRLLALEPVVVDRSGFEFREVMSVTLAEGGRARNVIPDKLVLNLNYRFAPGRSLDSARQQVLDFVGDDARVVFTDLAPSGTVFADHPLFQQLLAATGAPARSKQAWTDVARLALHGIPAVNFGPGESAQAHQARERIPVANLVVGYRMLERFLTAG